MIERAREIERLRCPECLAVFRNKYAFCPVDGNALVMCGEEPLLGSTIAERYVVEELVGEGAMGMVYKARHIRLPRDFAVKVLFGDLAADPAMRLRFAQEAAAASTLGHQNVVPVVDFGKSERGLLYLVMEFVEGQTLSEIIAREAPLDPLRVIELVRQVAQGLGHAHGQGLVHRDFKPDNVILAEREDGSRVPRILDFGLAISSREETADARLTQNGYVVGTPIYISPEQARDLAVDHRADLFAVGVVMYEMLSGHPPFDGPAMDVAHKNMAVRMPRISERNPEARVPPELETIVMRLVEKAPEDRYQSAEELINALDSVERMLSGTHATMMDLPRAEVLPPAATAARFLEPFDSAEFAMRESLLERMRPGRRAAVATTLLASVALIIYMVTSRGREVATATVAAKPVAAAPTPVAGLIAPTETRSQAAVEPETKSAETKSAETKSAETKSAETKSAETKSTKAAEPRRTTPAPAPKPRRAAPAPARDPLVAASTARPLVEVRRSGSSGRAAAAPAAAATADAETVEDSTGVDRLVGTYREVGDLLSKLEASIGSQAAKPYLNRYFQVPYADGMRIPTVRRDALAQLGALRHDIGRILRK